MLTDRFGQTIWHSKGVDPFLSREVAGSGGHLSHLSGQGAFKRDNCHDASDDRGAATRNLRKRIASALEISDLIALMMVFVARLTA